MTNSNHDCFTLLYEDEDTRVLHEFKAIVADDVMQHMIDFLKGVGYCEETIFDVMQAKAVSYFESSKPLVLPMQQDDLEVA